jgi:hypothetical protein
VLNPRTITLAATGLLPPDAIARLAGMSEAELMARHGAEIRAAQRAVRGKAVAAILALQPTPEALLTAREADEAEWPGTPQERRAGRCHAALRLVAFACRGRGGRHVAACDRLLALDDATWTEVGDNRPLLLQHLEAIFRDAKVRPRLRRKAGRALLTALSRARS